MAAYTFKSTFGIYEITDRALSVAIMCDRVRLAQQTVDETHLVNGRPYAYYDNELREKLLEDQELISQMALALQEGQFKTYFQPVYDTPSGQVIGAEALVRWDHPERGLIPPMKFIPLFEQNGLITQLDRYVWNQSAAFLERRLEAGGRVVPVSVNVSRVDFYMTTLIEVFEDIVASHHIPKDLFRIEITETAYMDDPQRILEIINQLRSRGFTILLDDFAAAIHPSAR